MMGWIHGVFVAVSGFGAFDAPVSTMEFVLGEFGRGWGVVSAREAGRLFAEVTGISVERGSRTLALGGAPGAAYVLLAGLEERGARHVIAQGILSLAGETRVSLPGPGLWAGALEDVHWTLVGTLPAEAFEVLCYENDVEVPCDEVVFEGDAEPQKVLGSGFEDWEIECETDGGCSLTIYSEIPLKIVDQPKAPPADGAPAEPQDPGPAKDEMKVVLVCDCGDKPDGDTVNTRLGSSEQLSFTACGKTFNLSLDPELSAQGEAHDTWGEGPGKCDRLDIQEILLK